MVDPATGIAGVKVIMDLLKLATEKLKGPKPDVPGALTLIGQTQQHLDQLRSHNFELERQLLKAERENFELQKSQQQNDAWERAQALYELKVVYGKTRLYVPKDGADRQLCPKCFESDHKEITLQGGISGFATCPVCKGSYQVRQRTQ